MERSSTPSAACGASLLAARDARQEAMAPWLGAGQTLLALSLGVPGPDKAPPGAAALFAWAAAAVEGLAPGARRVHASADALGPFALFTAPGDPAALKRGAVALEASRPVARLLDLDVYSPEGHPVDRASLQLPPRACLCCSAPARACIRAGRHPPAALVAAALALLAGPGP